MRILSSIGYGFMALVLAGGWAFIYWQSSAVDLAAVEASRNALTELRAIDAGWNQRLVGARLHAGEAQSAPSRYRAVYGQLEVKALRLGDARIGSELVQLKRAFDEGARWRYARARGGATEAADADRAAPLGTLADAIRPGWLAPTGPASRWHAPSTAASTTRWWRPSCTASAFYYSGFLLAVLFLVQLTSAGARSTAQRPAARSQRDAGSA
jgi:hypothetical protein